MNQHLFAAIAEQRRTELMSAAQVARDRRVARTRQGERGTWRPSWPGRRGARREQAPLAAPAIAPAAR